MDNTLHGLYDRTMNNCKFYERENMSNCLLNEVGVLRGIAYCLEISGDSGFLGDPDFLHFIEIQGKQTEKEKDAKRGGKK